MPVNETWEYLPEPDQARVKPLQWLKPYTSTISRMEVREAVSLSGLAYRCLDTGAGIACMVGVTKLDMRPDWETAIQLCERDHALRILSALDG